MRTKGWAWVGCGAFLIAGGFFANAAAPERRFEGGLRSLRANKPEEVQYKLVSIENRPDYQSQASLLRAWLRLQAKQTAEPNGYLTIWTDLNDALDDNRHHALTLALMGRILYEGGRLAEAVDMLQKALQEDPAEVEAYRWLGVALYDIGAMTPALEYLERAAGLEPTNGRLHRLMGLIYQERGDYKNAVLANKESLARDPLQPDADEIRLDLARCHAALHDYDAALETLRQCPDSAEVLALRGECYFATGRVNRAEECVERALKLDPQNAEALVCRYDCWLSTRGAAAREPESTGAPSPTAKATAKEALEFLLRAVEASPSDYRHRYRLMQTYRLLGETELADEQREIMERLRSKHEELQRLISQANYDLTDVSLRYDIAALADSLDMSELAANWRRAAQMLDMANRRSSGSHQKSADTYGPSLLPMR